MKKKIKKQMKHWRRSSKRQGLSQRDERLKDKDPIIEKRGKTYLYAEESDECWNLYDPSPDIYDYCYSGYEHPYEEEIEHYNLHHRLVEEIIRLPGAQFNELEPLARKLTQATESYSLNNKYLLLEKSLYEHIKMLQCIQTEEIADKAFHLREAAGDRKNIEAVLEFSKRIHNIQVARAIMLFSPFWVRSPHSWEGGDEACFIKHVFAQFDVPDYLHYEWLRAHESIRFKWLSWFIILGQGGSLKKAATYFHWRIPSRLQHHLQNMTPDLSPLEACFFAEIKRLGGSDTDAIRLLQNGALVIDPTELEDASSEDNYLLFWQSTIHWLIKHSQDISDDESNNIINWALHEYTETNRGNWLARREWEEARQANDQLHNTNQPQSDLPQPSCFTMKGRSVERVLELSNEYYQLCYQQQTSPQSNYSWKKHGWDYIFEDPAYIGWKIIELTNGEELRTEGAKMRHCVSGYAGRCIADSSAIFSLRQYGEMAVTIEVHPKSKKIVQAKGKLNRNTNSLESELISKWVKEVLRKKIINEY